MVNCLENKNKKGFDCATDVGGVNLTDDVIGSQPSTSLPVTEQDKQRSYRSGDATGSALTHPSYSIVQNTQQCPVQKKTTFT